MTKARDRCIGNLPKQTAFISLVAAFHSAIVPAVTTPFDKLAERAMACGTDHVSSVGRSLPRMRVQWAHEASIAGAIAGRTVPLRADVVPKPNRPLKSHPILCLKTPGPEPGGLLR